ncbi:TPA: hypothetical protein P3M42_005797, partial [Klebsiella pneumoniae]|nr:hypothetical protein [Klebsiella pneumoniae]
KNELRFGVSKKGEVSNERNSKLMPKFPLALANLPWVSRVSFKPIGPYSSREVLGLAFFFPWFGFVPFGFSKQEFE